MVPNLRFIGLCDHSTLRCVRLCLTAPEHKQILERLSVIQMKKLLSITAIIIVFFMVALYFLDDLKYTEVEKEWCKEHRPLMPIEMCAKEFGY